jgi:hypothetical protein
VIEQYKQVKFNINLLKAHYVLTTTKEREQGDCATATTAHNMVKGKRHSTDGDMVTLTEELALTEPDSSSSSDIDSAGHDSKHNKTAKKHATKEKRKQGKAKEELTADDPSDDGSNKPNKESHRHHHHHHHHHPKTNKEKLEEPIYHWENHGETTGVAAAVAVAERRRSSKKASVSTSNATKVEKRLKKLVKENDDSGDDVFDSSEGDEGERRVAAILESGLPHDEDEDYDEEALDMEEDEALRTTPTTPNPTSPRQRIVSLDHVPASPRGVVASNQDNILLGNTRKSPSPGIPTIRHSLGPESLGPAINANSGGGGRPSFIPPFLVDGMDDEDDDDEPQHGPPYNNRRRHSLELGPSWNSHNNESASSGDWSVPESMGMDEGLPEINQERCLALR